MLGMILALALFIFLAVVITSGIFYSATQPSEVSVAPHSILKISLNEEISDRSSQFFDSEKYKIKDHPGLFDIVKDIKNARNDANITGIYMDLDLMSSAGYASLEEIRNALLDFKKSGKFIYSYAEVISQKAYYLNSVSDKVFLNPAGMMEFDGFSSQYTFFKGALDKLEIEPQIFRVGKFKSFVEPFTLTSMSTANKEQIQSYMGSEFSHYIKGISASRHIPADSLLEMSKKLKIQKPEDALRYHLVDGLEFKDQLLARLKKASGIKQTEDLKTISLENYSKTLPAQAPASDERIAIFYASGDIAGGEGSDNAIGSERLSRLIRQARLNPKVKALVLRVNSPGGGSMASAIIWREVSLTQKVKPVVVSMGNVAASGGYYIACAADKILAEPNTITGSIGIFAIIPNASRFFNDKLGITFDGVKTGDHSDMLTISRPLSPFEKQVIQSGVEKGYQEFISKVAQGRKASLAHIDSIGQGRVWTGEQALKIGLVDKLGSFDDAITTAAGLAHLKAYTLVSYPEQRSLFESLFSNITEQIKVYFIKEQLGSSYKYYQGLQELRNCTGMQARLPFDTQIN